MNIQQNWKRQIDTIRQVVHFTIIDDASLPADEYELSWNTPILAGQDLQDYLDANLDKFYLQVLGRQYPDAPNSIKSSKQFFEQWISDGAIVPAVLDESGNTITESYVATKIPWTNTHPLPRFKNESEAKDLSGQVEAMLQNITYDKINDHIDNTFGALTAGQRNSLKLVYKAVYYLLKRD